MHGHISSNVVNVSAIVMHIAGQVILRATALNLISMPTDIIVMRVTVFVTSSRGKGKNIATVTWVILSIVGVRVRKAKFNTIIDLAGVAGLGLQVNFPTDLLEVMRCGGGLSTP